ncbi:arsenic resistance N-acetyltransferase ArsN2 [Rhizobium sp. GN54]|uniref:arsenic resistance N-acetyltransferase ArsN2 n=1 Tax=Rhizobium sp. GN54 TaxID=2898150 RepID=UPI001E299AEF|nr:arsenic resistance N-acetyltransferase ArsN2 [Rhizobium sp. GN54]MCD2185453.1 arsenic resistance N-acetyltransferase ArsN2 [Rhizobium sp. GN54]
MTETRLEPVPGSDAGLKLALAISGLATEDLEDPGRSFFRAVSPDGITVGYAGIEMCGDAVLLRSMVILPEHRGKTLGRSLTTETLKTVKQSSAVFLATTTAAQFFENLGFDVVERADVPPAVLATRQLSGICPASATIMKLNRPPT